MRLLLIALALTPAAAQWQLQPSKTTASLRGIHAVTDRIAWTSGTAGTLLYTTQEHTFVVERETRRYGPNITKPKPLATANRRNP